MVIFNGTPSRDESRVNQSLHHQVNDFNFISFQHKDQIRKVISIIDNMKDEKGKPICTPSFFADMIASVFQTIKRSGRMDSKLVLRGLVCCRDIMQSLGYQEINIRKLIENMDLNRPNIIDVFGCQTPGILRNRVIATVKLCEMLPNKTHIVFSGLNPPNRDTTITINEALFMENEFYRLMADKIHPLDNITTTNIDTERLSQTTEDNIAKFLDLNKLQSNYNVFLVSSNFHLIKLARLWEANSSRLKHLNLHQFFIGSEHLHIIDYASDRHEYVKALFYQVYEHFFSNGILDFKKQSK